MMKKIIGLLLGVLSVCALSSCDVSALMGGGTSSESTQLSESVASEENSNHKHIYIRVPERAASCSAEGNVEYWKCTCGTLFADDKGVTETTLEEVSIAKSEHVLKYTQGVEPTCKREGRAEHWTCAVCASSFADEACTQTVKLTDLILTATHNLTHHEEIPVNGKENGVKEHWICDDCGYYFADAEGTDKMKQEETVILSVRGLTDFVVEVPAGRDPVVLQLTDTQIIDSAQARSTLSQGYIDHWAADRFDDLCFDYLDEIITAANPDFIIITGDLVHGAYDDNGTSLLALIEYMESWQIPWAPVFGNHENESKMGADWQSKQLENAEYCLFDQKELSGNGNYSVGLVQGNELLRVFYMLDTNACTTASDESMANGHTVNDYCGAKPDQIAWCVEQATMVRKYVPKVDISLACHIQPKVFEEAYFVKYGWSLQENKPNINIDLYEGKEEGDFGYIGKQLIGGWDHDKAFFNTMKGLGLDSIFVGHVHYNTASVVYEGVRLHYGVKSGEHDRVNAMNTTTGVIEEKDRVLDGYSPIIGGSIIVVSKTDGTLKDVYNYYCTDEAGVIQNGEIQWNRFVSTSAKTIAPRKEYAAFLKEEA